MTHGLLEDRERVEANTDAVIAYYQDGQTQFLLQQVLSQVKTFFELHPALHAQPLPIVHSIKSRLKDPEHLRDKLERKATKGIMVTKENLFEQITDLIGVRVLHLHQDQFEHIHVAIMDKVTSGDWVFGEPPKAYTWDPETERF